MPLRKNIADALSRLTKISASDQTIQDDRYLHLVALHAVPTALRLSFERILAQDPELQSVRNCLIKGKWDSAPKGLIALEPDILNVPGQTPQDLAFFVR